MELQMFSLKLCKFPYRIIGLISSILFTHCGHKQKSYLYKDKTNCIIQIITFFLYNSWTRCRNWCRFGNSGNWCESKELDYHTTLTKKHQMNTCKIQ